VLLLQEQCYVNRDPSTPQLIQWNDATCKRFQVWGWMEGIEKICVFQGRPSPSAPRFNFPHATRTPSPISFSLPFLFFVPLPSGVVRNVNRGHRPVPLSFPSLPFTPSLPSPFFPLKVGPPKIHEGNLWGTLWATRTLVSCDEISCHWVREFPQTRASKRGTP